MVLHLSQLPEYLQGFKQQLDACPLGITVNVVCSKNEPVQLVVSIKSFKSIDSDDFGIYEDGSDVFTAFRYECDKITEKFGLFLDSDFMPFLDDMNVEAMIDPDLDLFTPNADPDLDLRRVVMLQHLRVTPMNNVPKGYIFVSEIKEDHALFRCLPDYLYTASYIVPLNSNPLSFEMYTDAQFVEGFGDFRIQYAPQ